MKTINILEIIFLQWIQEKRAEVALKQNYNGNNVHVVCVAASGGSLILEIEKELQ